MVWAGRRLAGITVRSNGLSWWEIVNKDIRFPSDICKHRAAAGFCQKGFLQTRPALWSFVLGQRRRCFLQRGLQEEEAGPLCWTVTLILLFLFQFSRQPENSKCYRTSMDEKTAPSKDSVWPWASRRRRNVTPSTTQWKGLPFPHLPTPSLPADLSSVGLSVSDARCLFGPPVPSLFSRMAHCFLCWRLLLSILTASPIALVLIHLADLPSLLSSGFYFRGTCWTHSRYLSGNSSKMYPKLNSFPSPSRPVPLWLPVSVMVSPFK